MDCHGIQERFLESLDAGPPDASVQEHLAVCQDCARFAALQRQLELRLREHFTAPQLSAGFRPELRKRMAREKAERWPDWLPDAALAAGAGLAIPVCGLLLPMPLPTALGVGALAAFAAYTVQTLLISALERVTD